jgi:hypothetical protein
MFDGASVRLTCEIPQGAAGEVRTLDDAFVNDPPTLADLELMRVKMNELITALRR